MKIRLAELYNAYALLTTKSKKSIFVECFYGKELSGDVKYILSNLSDYHIYVAYIDEELKSEIQAYGYQAVKFETIAYYKAFYQSRIILSNLNLYPRLFKKHSQYFIQLWHGYPLKKMVRELNDHKQANKEAREFKKAMKKWDALLISSRVNYELLNDAFGEFKKIKIIKSRAPRVEFLLNNMNNEVLKKRLKRKYKIDEYRRVILFAPTWRKNDENRCSLDFEKIALITDSLVIIKNHVHDHSLDNYLNSSNVKVIDNCFDIYELLLISDCLISDYSSIIVDYLIMSDRVILHSSDNTLYEEQVGLKVDLKNSLNLEVKNYTTETLLRKLGEIRLTYYKPSKYIVQNVIGNYQESLTSFIVNKMSNR